MNSNQLLVVLLAVAIGIVAREEDFEFYCLF